MIFLIEYGPNSNQINPHPHQIIPKQMDQTDDQNKKANNTKKNSKKDDANKKDNIKKDVDKKDNIKKDADDDDADISTTFKPDFHAQMVISAMKQYQLQVYAKVVDLGDDPDQVNLTKCMSVIREDKHPAVQNCSVILITGGSTDVVALAYSKDPTKIGVQEWIKATLETLPHNSMILGENFGRVTTTQDAPPIKAKETALSSNFAYLRKIGAMPKDDDEDDQFVDYSAML
jgi:hypothetical protein